MKSVRVELFASDEAKDRQSSGQRAAPTDLSVLEQQLELACSNYTVYVSCSVDVRVKVVAGRLELFVKARHY